MNIINLYEIVGIIITFVSAVFVYRNSKEEHKKQQTIITSTLGLILTLLVSLRFDNMPNIDKNFKQLEYINQYEDSKRFVDIINESYDKATEIDHNFLDFYMSAQLKIFERNFDNVASGQFIVYPSELSKYANQMLDFADKSIYATSYVRPDKWWETEWGKIYLQKNYDKVKEGVIIERTFIFSTQKEFDEYEYFLEQQANNGITVRYVLAKDLSSFVTSDMIVIDDNEIAGDLTLTPEKEIQECVFSVSDREVSHVLNKIISIQNEARLYKPKPKS